MNKTSLGLAKAIFNSEQVLKVKGLPQSIRTQAAKALAGAKFNLRLAQARDEQEQKQAAERIKRSETGQ